MAARQGGWLWPALGLHLLATAFQAVSALGAELSSEACRELGFSRNLLCRSCDLLGQFDLLQLDPICRGCCQEEAQFETKSCMPELSLKSVDENWGGSLKSKVCNSH